ncbi:MAG TPA: flagellar hook-basal body complex protein, partial [Pirellulales bacterium]
SHTTLTTDSVNHPQLNSTNLNGNYTYRITWSANDNITPESRPSPPVSVTVTDGRLVLSGLTAPTGPPYAVAGGTINIYRNVAGQPDTFYRVGQVPDSTTTFTDSMSDLKAIDTTNVPNYQVLDPDGPTIATTTLLKNVLSRSGNTYTNLFQRGTLIFTGAKGGDTLGAKTLTITDSTNVEDLMEFMQQSLGIQLPSADSHNPVPNDGPTGRSAGISIENGKIEIVSNVGTDNAVGIPLSAFKLTPSDGSLQQTPNLGFSQTQAANGQSAAGDFIVYDSLGIPLNVRITTVLEGRDSAGTTYRWFADSSNNDPTTGSGIAVGTGEIKFDGNGNVVSTTNSTVSVDRTHVASDTPLQFNLDFSDVSGLAADSSSLAAARQDGSAAGTLTSYNIGDDGTINGVFSNGVSRTLGQVLIAGFRNPEGLQAIGNNDYAAGVNSGLPQIGTPGTQGRGTITAGAVELSNTDIGKNLIQLILASTAYQGNTRVISTVDNMLQVLLTLNR